MRKNPRQERAQETVKTIFEATAQILESEGLEKLTTNHVAAVAGISIGTVYQYFSNRQALLLALGKYENERVLQAYSLALANRGQLTLEQSIRENVRLTLQMFGGRNEVRRATLLATMQANPGQSNQVLDKIAAILKDKLSDGTRAGLRPASDAMIFVITRALSGAIRSAVLEQSKLLGTPEFEDELVQLFLGMLKS